MWPCEVTIRVVMAPPLALEQGSRQILARLTERIPWKVGCERGGIEK